MARPLRIERVGEWYHVTARGNERKAIFRDDRDRLHFLELLAEMVGRFRVRLRAYVLMANHYHLLVELRETNLSVAAHWLNVSHSVWFNRRHNRSGHLFQGRFKSIVVSREEWGLELSRYIHLNPVRTGRLGLGKADRQRSRQGLSEAPSAEQVRERLATLRGYRWSSYRAYAGTESSPVWLDCEDVLRLGGGGKKEQRARYRDQVEKAVREGLAKSPWENVRDQVVLGGQEFMRKVESWMGAKESGRRMRGIAVRPKWAKVVAAVEQVKGEKWASFRDRHGDRGRDLAMYLGQREGGLTLRELAEACGMKSAAAAGISVARYTARLPDEPREQAVVERATQLLNVGG